MYTRQQSVVTRLVSWHKILASQRALQRRPRPHLQNKTRRILFQNPSQRQKKEIDAYIKFLKSKEGQEAVAVSQAAADAGNPVKTQVPVEEGGKPSDILHWNLNKVVVENGKDTLWFDQSHLDESPPAYGIFIPKVEGDEKPKEEYFEMLISNRFG